MDNIVVELRNTLSDHFVKAENDSAGASVKTTAPQSELDAKPLRVKKTVTYIVCAVVIKDGRVLMMREAKKSCYGLWYLPAGRLERDETLVDGVRREVLEETGLIFEPTSLFSVEYDTLDWFRFNFTGRITGGKLKTLANQDKESLEAGWFTPSNIFNKLQLRARDVCPIIETAIHWKSTKMSDPLFTALPHQKPHSRISYQIIVILKEEATMKVLIDKESSVGFLEITPQLCRVAVNLGNFVNAVVGNSGTGKKNTRVHGIMRVEHNGGPFGVGDGIQMTYLVEITPTLPPPPPSSSSSAASTTENMSGRYKWCPIDDENLCSKLRKLCENGCIKRYEL